MIAIKQGVKIKGIQPEIVLAISAVQSLWPEGLTITSVKEGNHMQGSLHYVGLAADLRLPKENVQQVRDTIAAMLGAEYDVILEKDHIHIEYDPK